MSSNSLVTNTGIELRPDPSRVVVRFFVPGQEDVGPGDSRAATVIARILRLDDATVLATVADLDERFSARHDDLHRVYLEHAAMTGPRLDDMTDLSEARRLMLGASFTHEYSIEGAALCNPSIVVAPSDGVVDDNGASFIMSVRGIGEGHRSSIGFRTGFVSNTGVVTIDEPGAFPITAAATPGDNYRTVFHSQLDMLGDDRENAAYVLDGLPELFDDDALYSRIDSLNADATRRNAEVTMANLRGLARASYRTEFPIASLISERVLWPHAPAESHGMEDARFVRFIDGERVTYYATYTAFDGVNIAQHLLETLDFRTFHSSPIAGSAAIGKGLAIFPRKIGGQYVALSRSDRETNSIAFSDDLHCWDSVHTIQEPEEAWEVLQLGNSGSPIETSEGWLVLVHGVGPMRTYSLSALLLDLDDPRRVLARSREPILKPDSNQRDGYVPNVVYTCGALAHGDTLVIPYGVGDQSIRIATLSIDALLAGLRRDN